MNRIPRDRLIRIMLVVSCVALLGTSAPAFEPEVHDRLEQQVVLDGERPTAATTIRVSASAATLPPGSRSYDSELRFAASASRVGPELAMTVVGRPDGIDERGDEMLDMRLEDVCVPGDACDAILEVTVEWVNAAPGEQATVTLTVEAGVDYTNSLIELARAPSDAALELASVEKLTAQADVAAARRQIDPETIALTSDAPFALRSGWVELDATGSDLQPGAEVSADVVITAETVSEQPAEIRIWSDRSEAEPGRVTPGEVMSIACPARQTCRYAYTLVAEWNGRTLSDQVDVRWALAAVLRDDRDRSAVSDGTLSVGVDRSVSTSGTGRVELSVTASGSIAREPGDAPVEVPVEPGDGPHTAEATLSTWTPVPRGSAVGIPTTGELRIVARRTDGGALVSSVRIGVVTHYPVTGDSSLRNRELTPAAPTLAIALKPSLSCYDTTYLDPTPPDGYCSVPFDIYVQPPDESDGPVVVEWEIALRAVAPDGFTLTDGDLRLLIGGDR